MSYPVKQINTMFSDFERLSLHLLPFDLFLEPNTNDENLISCVYNKAGISYMFLIKALRCIRQGHD